MINQIGWDVRKDDELLRWIRRDGAALHALANVYLLSRPAARAFHQGKIPGVVVTDRLLELAEHHGASADKGRAFFVDLAAKHLAVSRGLGFDGAYLGGHTPAATFGEIVDLAAVVRAGRLALVRSASSATPSTTSSTSSSPTSRRASRRTPSAPPTSTRSAAGAPTSACR